MASLFGIINEETPKYDLLKKSPAGYEIRRYHRQIQAAVTFPDSGEGPSTQNGFRDLAGYIFGGNKKRDTSAEKPENDKIAMTAPVMSYHNQSEKTTTMSFILPSKYASISDLPVPNNQDVKLEEVEPYTAAVLKFSGRWTKEETERQYQKLVDLIKQDEEVKVLGAKGEGVEMKLARYNPPWTLPFLRTTEVIVPVDFSPKSKEAVKDEDA